jgi:hypothetical protein
MPSQASSGYRFPKRLFRFLKGIVTLQQGIMKIFDHPVPIPKYGIGTPLLNKEGKFLLL